MNGARTQLSFANVRAIETGYFRICIIHFEVVFDVGRIVVRPRCDPPTVMLQGACLKHCSTTTVPIAGQCRPVGQLMESITSLEEESEAVMVSLRMSYPGADSKGLVNLSRDDPVRDYFDYRFTYELAGILDTDPSRFHMVQISRNSTTVEADRIIVSVVMKPVGSTRSVELHYDEEERSPLGLYGLLGALLVDTNSLLYANDFFDTVDQSFPLRPVYVQLCEEDGQYRVMCPLLPLGVGSGGAKLYFTLGVIMTTVALILLGSCVWKLDVDPASKASSGRRVKYRTAEVSTRDLGYLDPSMRSEFAR